MRTPRVVRSTVTAVAVLAAASAVAQNRPAAPQPEATDPPDPSSLTVGALQIGSAAALAIPGIDIGVTGNSVTYSYYLRNAGTTELHLRASVALPELETSADGSETWVLPSSNPENPVDLTITAADTPVQTTAQINVTALNIDRTADIRAEHLPLIPFGPATDKALASLPPHVADRLAASGVISSRDPSQPDDPPIANWTLKVVRSGQLILPPGRTTSVAVKFTPIVGQYRLGKDDQDSIDDMKDDVCLKPPVLGMLQSRLKNGGVWRVTDMSLATEAPTVWNDSPTPTLSVQKPGPNAIVAFCGIDEKTASRPLVLGTAPEDSTETRIVIFQPAAR